MEQSKQEQQFNENFSKLVALLGGKEIFAKPKLENVAVASIVEELIAAVYFDADKGKVSIIKPDINTFSLLLRKYGYEKYETLHESVKALFAQTEEQEAENNQ